MKALVLLGGRHEVEDCTLVLELPFLMALVHDSNGRVYQPRILAEWRWMRCLEYYPPRGFRLEMERNEELGRIVEDLAEAFGIMNKPDRMERERVEKSFEGLRCDAIGI